MATTTASAPAVTTARPAGLPIELWEVRQRLGAIIDEMHERWISGEGCSLCGVAFARGDIAYDPGVHRSGCFVGQLHRLFRRIYDAAPPERDARR